MPRLARPSALTMPIVTVWLSPNGLPIASTTSATSTRPESPKAKTGKSFPGSLTIARSVLGSAPMSLPVSSRRSARVTLMSCAPSTTWLLVITMPSAVTSTPEPRLRSRCGPSSGPPKKRKNGSEKNGPGIALGPRTVLVEEMLTTAGIAAFATAVQPDAGAPALMIGPLVVVNAQSERSNGHHQRARAEPGLASSSHPATMTAIQSRACPDRPRSQTCQRRIRAPPCVQHKSVGQLEPQAAELEPERDEEDGEDDCVCADPQHQGQGPYARPDREHGAEGHGQHTGEGEPPLPPDVPSQHDRGRDLEDTGEEGRGSDHVHYGARGQVWNVQGDRAHSDTHQAFEQERPPPPLAPPAAHRRDDVEHAIDDGEAAEQEHERGQADGGPERGEDAEDQRGDAPQGHRPPVLDQRYDVHFDDRDHMRPPGPGLDGLPAGDLLGEPAPLRLCRPLAGQLVEHDVGRAGRVGEPPGALTAVAPHPLDRAATDGLHEFLGGAEGPDQAAGGT